MTFLLQLFFWLSIALLFHSYVGYPLFTVLASKLKRDKRLKYSDEDPLEKWPTLIVVMAAYNEEAVIGDTLESALTSDYPSEKLHFFIGSDNSTDGTHGIIERFQKDYENLQLKVFGSRTGKLHIINNLVTEECMPLIREGNAVLISCDANVRWSPELPKKLARHFKDADVGQVATNVLDVRNTREGIGDQEQTYISSENVLKHAEGKLWGRTMGAFGACFAHRAELFKIVPDAFTCDDFFLTMHVFTEGFDVVTDLEAVAYENVSEKITEEFRRKKRICIGNLLNFEYYRDFLLPWTPDFWTAYAFWSHKGIRWFGPVLLIIALLTSAFLAMGGSFFFMGAFAAQVLGYLSGMVDHHLEQKGKRGPGLFRHARYFAFVNLAMLMGLIQFLTGNKSSVWQPTERVVDGKAVTGQ